MPNLNAHDIVFIDSDEFKGFKELIEYQYKFKILSSSFADIISFTSRKLILHTSDGDFFLKEKPQYCSDKLSLERSANFQNFASKNLKIIPEIIQTRSKNSYIQWKGRFYFITSYRKGRYYNGTESDIRSMLNALLALQSCGRVYFSEYAKVFPDELAVYESIDIAKNLSEIRKFILSKDDQIIYERILEMFRVLALEYSSFKEKRYCMAHSDVILFNIILLNSEVLSVNDFDNAKVLPIVHDMAEFLVSATMLNYNAPLTNLKSPLIYEPQAEPLSTIVRSYVQDFSLQPGEPDLIGIISEIVWLWTLALAILKGDYLISDLAPGITSLEKRKLSTAIKELFLNYAVSTS